ncbi:MAG: MBL fold metallo-hydrolase [Caldilineae bacterium]|nr:MAG: MBL fold metallo-hydrolase [Caldilineae bacterium]
MQEITPGLWDVDEVGNAVHVYAWQWDGGLTLIDTGLPGNGETILAALQRAGFSPQDVVRIIVTHGDVDHMGSLAELKAATGAEVLCHTVEKEFLEHPERRKPANTPLGILIRPVFFLARLLPRLRVKPVKPDRTFLDGTQLPEGFVVVHTPGHTPGHISLFHPERRLLISGDAVNNFTGKPGTPPSLFTPDMDAAYASIRKLVRKYGKEIDVIAFGHGRPILAQGGAQLAELAARLPGSNGATP